MNKHKASNHQTARKLLLCLWLACPDCIHVYTYKCIKCCSVYMYTQCYELDCHVFTCAAL